MTTIDDLLEFKQEMPLIEMQEFEETVRTLNREPWRAEIKELRGLVTSLSEQGAFLIQEFEDVVHTLNKEPWRAEISELRGLVASLSEQVALLQEQVTLPARTVTLYADRCHRGLLLHNGHPFNDWTPNVVLPPKPVLQLQYTIIKKGSGGTGGYLSIAENGSGKLVIPCGHTLCIVSTVWKLQTTSRYGGICDLQSQPLKVKLRYEYSYEVSTNGGEI